MRPDLASAVRDAACFLQGPDVLQPLLERWLQALPARPAHAVLLARTGAAVHTAWLRCKRAPAATALTPKDAGLLDKPFSLARIESRVFGHLSVDSRPLAKTVLVVDMDWLLQAPSAMANGALWATLIGRVLQQGTMACLSLYHRRHLPERDLLAGLHAHAAVVSADGCRANPFQLPAEANANPGSAYATQLRLDHWLAHLSPSQRIEPRAGARPTDAIDAPLSGGEPHELLRESFAEVDEPQPAAATSERWKIRCFGSLRAYRIHGEPIQWHRQDQPGKAGSTRKLRGLFAMLLLAGERGAAAAELVDVLWPDATSPERALNRLHHTVNELRRCLLPPTASDERVRPRHHPFLVRQDQRYFLRLPPNSWIDVEEFPQLCRQGGELLHDGRLREALLCFESALKLYTGDLFADLPASLTDDGDADWCASTRTWLRELCLKVHGDCARIHRELGNTLQAAAHCHALLKHDAGSGFAHAELMRLHAMQGRRDALDRQFQVYRQALLAAGHSRSTTVPLMGLYVELMEGLAPVKTLRKSAR
jgi:DNA-binding SARP family transcriptional activator